MHRLRRGSAMGERPRGRQARLLPDRQGREGSRRRTIEQIKNLPEFHRDKHLGDTGHREEHGTYCGTGAPFGGRSA
ncbi:hypothetical protein [Streptomyces zaomyceticus]|uniref:hypothetical protein n=1 Tax=Streptomyces zaomyceticus TaxID=68286 RepID=UPI0033B5ED85